MQKYAINWMMVRNKHPISKVQSSNISKVVELIFKGELNCLEGCFRKQTGREDVKTQEP